MRSLYTQIQCPLIQGIEHLRIWCQWSRKQSSKGTKWWPYLMFITFFSLLVYMFTFFHNKVFFLSPLQSHHHETTTVNILRCVFPLTLCPKEYIYNYIVYVLSPSHVWLFSTPRTAALQGPLSMRILQARILEWVTMPSSRGSFWSRDRTCMSDVSCIVRQVLYH